MSPPFRLRALLVSVLLTLVVTSVGEATQEATRDEAQGMLAPSPELQRELAALQAEEEAERRRRATPEARAERQRSRSAFSGLSPVEALGLARRAHPDVFAVSAFRRFVAPAGTELKRLTEYGALLEGETPEDNRLIESHGAPFSSTLGSGERELLDLSLEAGPAGFAPRNPSVATRLGAARADVGEVHIEVLGTENARAEESNGRVFTANALPDTDVVVSPTPKGAQFAFVVRSADAPEEAELAFAAPGGLQLQAAAGGNPDEIQVHSAGEVVGAVRPPVAWDADGVRVPVAYDIADGRLVVKFTHRERDVRYPLYVDPLYEKAGGQYGTTWPGWELTGLSYSGDGWNQSGTGTGWLYLQNKAGQWFTHWDYARYHWTNPRGYVSRLDWQYVFHTPVGTCATMGLFNSASTAWKSRVESCAQASGTYPVVTNTDGAYRDRPAMQLWMNVGGVRHYSATFQTWGLQVSREDVEAPSMTSPIPSSAWFTDLNSQGQIVDPTYTLAASDLTGGYEGTGVHRFLIYKTNEPTGNVVWKDHGCIGYAGNLCPGGWATNVSWRLAEGPNELTVGAVDALGKPSPSQFWTLNVDRTKPALDLSGSLYDGRTATTPITKIRGNHTLKVVPSEQHSGIASIQVYVNGNPQCSTSGGACSTDTFTWAYNGATHGPGLKTITVVAKDKVGLETTRSFDVYWDPRPCP